MEIANDASATSCSAFALHRPATLAHRCRIIVEDFLPLGDVAQGMTKYFVTQPGIRLARVIAEHSGCFQVDVAERPDLQDVAFSLSLRYRLRERDDRSGKTEEKFILPKISACKYP